MQRKNPNRRPCLAYHTGADANTSVVPSLRLYRPIREHAYKLCAGKPSLPAHIAFGPGFDQVMGDGNGRWHTQVRMLLPERREDVSAGEPADIGHLFVVNVDISGQGAGVTADHQ